MGHKMQTEIKYFAELFDEEYGSWIEFVEMLWFAATLELSHHTKVVNHAKNYCKLIT